MVECVGVEGDLFPCILVVLEYAALGMIISDHQAFNFPVSHDTHPSLVGSCFNHTRLSIRACS